MRLEEDNELLTVDELVVSELRLAVLSPVSLLTVPGPVPAVAILHTQMPLEQSVTAHWQEQEEVSNINGSVQVVIVLQTQSQTESSQCWINALHLETKGQPQRQLTSSHFLGKTQLPVGHVETHWQ